jgi:hypothetical protein
MFAGLRKASCYAGRVSADKHAAGAVGNICLMGTWDGQHGQFMRFVWPSLSDAMYEAQSDQITNAMLSRSMSNPELSCGI